MTRLGQRCAPRMAACGADCQHRLFVEAYQAQREQELAAMEQATALHPGDVADYVARYGRPVCFREFLERNRTSTR